MYRDSFLFLSWSFPTQTCHAVLSPPLVPAACSANLADWRYELEKSELEGNFSKRLARRIPRQYTFPVVLFA